MTDSRIISIGTLAAHPLWEERGEVRTGHATTTLVTSGSMQLLVDPSLPPTALLARLSERTPVRPDEITHVFLTSADALHRRGLAAFESAEWLVGEVELTQALADAEQRLEAAGDDELLLEHLAVLRRCRPAPDRLGDGVDLFPLPGVTPGCCGLLLPLPQSTMLIAGDAVATREHLEQGKVLPNAHNLEQALESFAEAVQIADIVVPGRDNITVNPLRPFVVG